jgi:hypothetical protein
MPVKNTTVLTPVSAISAVTTGTHIPHMTRSILVQVVVRQGTEGSEADMPLFS